MWYSYISWNSACWFYLMKVHHSTQWDSRGKATHLFPRFESVILWVLV
jgi:hypothetical protein